MRPHDVLLFWISRRSGLLRRLGNVPGLWRVKLQIDAMQNRARLENFARVPQNGVCAELGVFRGTTSAMILEVTRPRKLHLVDPWSWSSTESAYFQGRSGEETYSEVSQRYLNDSRVQIHRTTSEAFLRSLDVGSLDWVYIDANHEEPAVACDLRLAWQSVKPGGWITGDDYYWRNGEGRLSVKAALDEFCRELGVRPQFAAGQFRFRRHSHLQLNNH